jgi:hypothetical protein
MASYLDMIAAHLNAPYGALVSADDVLAVLRHGGDALGSHDRAVASILGSLFDECRPGLIEHACNEAGVSEREAAAAYVALVALGARRVPAWDDRALDAGLSTYRGDPAAEHARARLAAEVDAGRRTPESLALIPRETVQRARKTFPRAPFGEPTGW